MKKQSVFLLSMIAAGILAGCSKNNQPTQQSTNSANSSLTSSNAQNDQQQAKDFDDKINVSLEEALNVFRSQYPNTAITGLEIDSSFGNYFYKIEGWDDTNEYTLKVDALTTDVKDSEQEALDSDDKNPGERDKETLETQGIITPKRAAELAINHLKTGEAVEWQLEKENGVTYWEVKVKENTKETDVKLEAKTGKILQTEVD